MACFGCNCSYLSCAWVQGFDLQARKADIETIVASNTFMAELQSRIVPVIVQYEDFWTRYFYQ